MLFRNVVSCSYGAFWRFFLLLRLNFYYQFYFLTVSCREKAEECITLCLLTIISVMGWIHLWLLSFLKQVSLFSLTGVKTHFSAPEKQYSQFTSVRGALFGFSTAFCPIRISMRPLTISCYYQPFTGEQTKCLLSGVIFRLETYVKRRSQAGSVFKGGN